MSNSDIEIRLSKLLMEIAEGERSIEITRRVLSDCIEFDSYQIFKNLDYENKNAISPQNIMNYFQQKMINISPEEAKLIILFYDKDHDGMLSYDEIIDLIQTKNYKNKKIKKLPLNEGGINYNIEFSLAKLFEKELKLAKEVIYSLNNLKRRANFDIHNIFHLMKATNCITIESLRIFLDKNTISFLESDLNFIFNRLDINKDGKVDFVEFHSLLGFPECFYCCPCIICPFCKTICCNECLFGTNGCIHHNINSPCNCPKNGSLINNSYLLNNRTNSPIRRNLEEKISNSLSLRFSPERKYAPIPIEICDNCNKINCSCNNYKKEINNGSTLNNNININSFINNSSQKNGEEKLSNSLSLRLSPERKYAPFEVKACNLCNTIPCSCKNKNKTENNFNFNQNNNLQKHNQFINNNTKININDDEINRFNYFLQTLMEGEKEIELYKVDLALKKDFNCEDIFRLFEYNGRGFISFEDLKYGLNLLDIKINDYIINLLMNRFDLMKKGKINYADFFDMVVPFQRSYRSMVEERIPLSDNPKKILNILNKNTITSLKKLFVCIIEFEFRINDMRKKIGNIKMNLMKLFNLIDVKNTGYFEYSDLINYLEKNKINFKQLNGDLLFIRLDKKRNGKIYFEELKDEFYPI